MRIANIRVEEVGSASNCRVRLSAQIDYQRFSNPETLWFEVDPVYGDALCPTSEPFLLCLFPLASLLGEPIELEAPVSIELVQQCHQIISVWKGWYPWLKSIEIFPSSLRPNEHAVGKSDQRITGQFFSGGVDSFFTLLHVPHSSAPEDLIQVFGFDIPLERPEENDVRLKRARQISEKVGKNVVEVTTNLKKTYFRLAPWGQVSHGAALAGIAHALSNRYKGAIISATHDNHRLIPWGSHPVIDPLFGTRRTHILHHGADFTRVEKLRFISGFELALDNLHVCYHEASSRNCGRCEKCLRTMVSLDLLGKLAAAKSFNLNPNALNDYLATALDTENSRAFASENLMLALECGRPEVAKQIEGAISRGRTAEVLNLFSPNHFFKTLINQIRIRFPAIVPPLRRLRAVFESRA